MKHQLPPARRCRIVLTGGPGGGKTTAADLFRREIGDRVVIVPEAARAMFSRRHFIALALAGAVSCTTPAVAMPRMSRAITGIVQKLDWQARETEILRSDTGERLNFLLIDRTIFVANEQVVDAAILQPGAKVEIIYHQPFFGRPYVTKVTLLSAPRQSL